MWDSLVAELGGVSMAWTSSVVPRQKKLPLGGRRRREGAGTRALLLARHL